VRVRFALQVPAVLAGLAVLWPGGWDAQDGAPPAGPPAREQAPSEPAPELVTCAELWAHPGRYLGRTVSLRVQFHSWIEEWNPFLTRFGMGEYRALRAWSDEQLPWLVEDFDQPRARLFVRQDAAADWALCGIERHQRRELLVAVRAVFAGQPWLEVLGVRPLVPHVPEGSVLHASRALELMKGRSWLLAAEELERALAGPLPEGPRAELERQLATCRAEAARPVRILRRKSGKQQ